VTEFPVGERLPELPAARPPSGRRLTGSSVLLERPDAARDAAVLYRETHVGADVDPGQWTYMAYGPFPTEDAFRTWLTTVARSRDPLFMVVREVSTGAPVGMTAFQRVDAANRTLELGNIWYVPRVRRSPVNTEAIYLMLTETFERGFRRVEWKCDALNARSIGAALRLGFSFEGIFRQHYIVRGRNRDTAWFAMLDRDWPEVRRNFETALADASGRTSLGALNETSVRRAPLQLPE
jgi:RimJ/RimL family protein N-acetyltransferase